MQQVSTIITVMLIVLVAIASLSDLSKRALLIAGKLGLKIVTGLLLFCLSFVSIWFFTQFYLLTDTFTAWLNFIGLFMLSVGVIILYWSVAHNLGIIDSEHVSRKYMQKYTLFAITILIVGGVWGGLQIYLLGPSLYQETSYFIDHYNGRNTPANIFQQIIVSTTIYSHGPLAIGSQSKVFAVSYAKYDLNGSPILVSIYNSKTNISKIYAKNNDCRDFNERSLNYFDCSILDEKVWNFTVDAEHRRIIFSIKKKDFRDFDKIIIYGFNKINRTASTAFQFSDNTYVYDQCNATGCIFNVKLNNSLSSPAKLNGIQLSSFNYLHFSPAVAGSCRLVNISSVQMTGGSNVTAKFCTPNLCVLDMQDKSEIEFSTSDAALYFYGVLQNPIDMQFNLEAECNQSASS